MSERGSSAQERGLIILVGLAIAATGLALYLPALRRARVPAITPIIIDNVHVILPRFLSARAKVDINHAEVEELTRLPGIGATLAERVIAYRVAHGPFTRVEELNNVNGIGNKVVEQIRDLVILSPTDKER